MGNIYALCWCMQGSLSDFGPGIYFFVRVRWEVLVRVMSGHNCVEACLFCVYGELCVSFVSVGVTWESQKYKGRG